MIADLHCHFPMHLLENDVNPHGSDEPLTQNVADHLRAAVIGVAAHLFNNVWVGSDWRVSLPLLKQGDAGLICSVLYWPAGEFRLGSTPATNAFTDLQDLLALVERKIANAYGSDPPGYLIARRPADLDAAGPLKIVHCVEGGFNLGPDPDAIDANVKWLACNGALYVTVAHLFFKGVATNAPALPFLSDHGYARIFHQPNEGLTDLGRSLIRAMYKYKVLVDISHMSQQAIDDTFALIKELGEGQSEAERYFPVLATHVGMRSENPDTQVYNLTEDTARRVRDSGGLIGVILAQHQLGTTKTDADSERVVTDHLKAIEASVGLDCCAIGTDLDGFIKPTLTGIDTAADYVKLAKWITDAFGAAKADGILYQNAATLVRKVLEAREATVQCPDPSS